LSTTYVDQDVHLLPRALFVVYKLLPEKELFRTVGFGLNAPAGPSWTGGRMTFRLQPKLA